MSIEAQLLATGRGLPVPEAPDVTDRVLARVRDLPTPRASRPRAMLGAITLWLVRGRRWLIGLLSVLVLSAITIAPVRAAIADWITFLGVQVRPVATPTPLPPASVPPATPGMTVAEAARLVGFAPVLPESLGPPDGVEVSADRRILSLTWSQSGRTLRLDQFRGTPDPVMAKTVADVEWVDLGGGRSALWLPTPHEAVVIRDGQPATIPPRVAAATLIWSSGAVTLRLEGADDKDDAVAIARTTP